VVAAVVCALAGMAVFQFYGNASRGYIDTSSLFYWWGYQWLNQDSETQHGLLIVALSAWLFWRALRARDADADEDRGRGARASRANSLEPRAGTSEVESVPSVDGSGSRLSALSSQLPAFAAMLGGLALHVIGFAVQQSRISIVALLLFSWGVLRLAGGKRWGAAALFPLAFLVFAIPLNVLDTVGFWLRLWVIKASAGLAHGAGIGVMQNGTQLFAPDGRYQYDVAAACSGVRSLMALTALSLLVGYLWFHTWWRRALMLLLCFPLVYLGNVARITGIIFAGHWKGQVWGERVHDVMGFGIFAIVLGGVVLAAEAMQHWWPEGGRRPPGDGDSRAADADAKRNPKAVARRSTTTFAAVVVVLSLAEMIFLHRLAHLPARGGAGVLLAADGKNPVELPVFLGTEWIGKRTEVTSVEREILPADTGFSRKLYVPVSNPAQSVFVSVVLSGRDRTSIHRPELCLVGQGWTILDSTPHQFGYPAPVGGVFPATLLRTQRSILTPRGRETSPDLVAYWFVSSERIAPTQWSRFTADAWNRLFHLRADRWAYVLLQTSARDGEAAALQRLQTVLDQVLPAFQPPVK
jgi:exosortase